MNTVSYTDGDGVNPVYNTLALSPLLSPYNPDGSINVQPLVGHQDVGFRLNPLTLTKENAVLDRRRRLRTYNTLYGELEIIKGLKYRINVLLDMRQDNYNQYRGANTVLTGSSSTPFLSNTALIQNGEAWYYDIYHQVTYDKTIAEKHILIPETSVWNTIGVMQTKFVDVPLKRVYYKQPYALSFTGRMQYSRGRAHALGQNYGYVRDKLGLRGEFLRSVNFIRYCAHGDVPFSTAKHIWCGGIVSHCMLVLGALPALLLVMRDQLRGVVEKTHIEFERNRREAQITRRSWSGRL